MRDIARRSFRLICAFGGGGGGAAGAQESTARFMGREAAFEMVGSFDNDAYACRAFHYLTGVEQVCADAREMTPAMMREFYGEEAPWAVIGSAPCQGSSKLLAAKKAAEAFYQLLNELALVNLRTIIEAWAPGIMHAGAFLGEGDSTWEERRREALSTLPAIVLFENVPNITSRAKKMLAELRRILVTAGYVIQDGFHECRFVGDLAQRRKRWFMVARNPIKVPAFLYLPPKRKGKVCGDVLNELPLPGDPAGGPMHELPAISALNWWRLWAIPAGGDWRDLLPPDGKKKRERFRRHGVERWNSSSATISGPGSNGPCAIEDPRPEAQRVEGLCSAPPLHLCVFEARPGAFTSKYKVTAEGEEAGTVTSAADLGQGAPSYADPRPLDLARACGGFTSMDHVLGWDQAARTVTGASRPGQGAPSCADPRPLAMAVTDRFKTTLGVLSSSEPANAVTCEAYPTTGAFSIADGRYGFHGTLGVLSADRPSGTVTCGAATTAGAFSYAAPAPKPLDLEAQRGNARMHWDKYAVRPWNREALTVHSATRLGSGAPAVAHPLSMPDTDFHQGSGVGRMGVLTPADVAGCVVGNARVNTGPFSYAGPVPLDLVPRKPCFDKGYAVIDREHEPSNTIAGTAAVGCGTYAITNDVPRTTEQAPLNLALGCAVRAGAYGVIDPAGVSPTVIASAKIDNSASAIAAPKHPPYVVLSHAEAKRVADGEITVPFAIIDRDHPEEPLAIVDDMTKPPYRWVSTTSKRGKVTRRKVVVPLVLISADGTWHRPLTTLELAVLQGLRWQHKGKPLDFGGGATAQRTLIGNMIPRPVGKAFGDQFLLAALASEAGCMFLYAAGGGGLWVTPEQQRSLLARGVRRVRPADLAKLDAGEVVLLDDAARPIRRRPKPKKRHQKKHLFSRLRRELQPPAPSTMASDALH